MRNHCISSIGTYYSHFIHLGLPMQSPSGFSSLGNNSCPSTPVPWFSYLFICSSMVQGLATSPGSFVRNCRCSVPTSVAPNQNLHFNKTSRRCGRMLKFEEHQSVFSLSLYSFGFLRCSLPQSPPQPWTSPPLTSMVLSPGCALGSFIYFVFGIATPWHHRFWFYFLIYWEWCLSISFLTSPGESNV